MVTINRKLYEDVLRWIPHNLEKARSNVLISTGARKCLSVYNKITVHQKLRIISNLNSCLCGPSKTNQTCLINLLKTLQQLITSFSGINGHVATMPLDHRRAMNSEWHATICMLEVIDEVRNKINLVDWSIDVS